MPKTTVSGPESKNPGRVFLVFDPNVKGDLPDAKAQSLYDEQKASGEAHQKKRDLFIAYMQQIAVKGGMTEEPVVLLNFGKVSVTLDDGKGRKKAKAPELAGKDIDWTKVDLALQSSKK